MARNWESEKTHFPMCLASFHDNSSQALETLESGPILTWWFPNIPSRCATSVCNQNNHQHIGNYREKYTSIDISDKLVMSAPHSQPVPPTQLMRWSEIDPTTKVSPSSWCLLYATNTRLLSYAWQGDILIVGNLQFSSQMRSCLMRVCASTHLNLRPTILLLQTSIPAMI